VPVRVRAVAVVPFVSSVSFVTVVPFVDMGVGVAHAAMLVGVRVEVAALPADEEAERQERDHRADGHLGHPLDPPWKERHRQHHGKPEPEERRPVTRPPCQSQRGGAAPRAVPLRQDQGRHRGQVVGIRRVAEPQEDRHQQSARDGATRQSVHVLFCGLMSPHSGPALTVISSAFAGSVRVAVARSVP